MREFFFCCFFSIPAIKISRDSLRVSLSFAIRNLILKKEWSGRLALTSDFGRDAAAATLDLTGDDDQELRKARSLMLWDRKKKKFVGQEDKKNKKILTESGVWIPATYKTDRYERWMEKSKVNQNQKDEESSDDDGPGKSSMFSNGHFNRGVPKGMNMEGNSKSFLSHYNYHLLNRREILYPKESVIDNAVSRNVQRNKNKNEINDCI